MNLIKFLEKVQRILCYRVNRYKGPVVTLGGHLDQYGAYTLADIISDEALVLSFGIGTNVNFEKSILKEYSMAEVYAFDPTPKSREFVEGLSLGPRFHFFPYGLADVDGKGTFYLPKNHDQVSCATVKNMYSSEDTIDVEMKSFVSILELTGLNHVDVLKMDIEGTEFNVIDDIIQSSADITQICLEIHPFFFKDRFRKSRDFTNKLIKQGYKISHITRGGLGEEMSFIKINT